MSDVTVMQSVNLDIDRFKAQMQKLKEQVKTMCDENNKLRAENSILREQIAKFNPSHNVLVDGNIDQW